MAYLKGFFYAFIGWLGVEFISSNEAILIRIPEGSPGWYLLLFTNFYLLFYGLYSIYKIIKRGIRCYQVKNFRNIKKRQEDATGKRNQDRSH